MTATVLMSHMSIRVRVVLDFSAAPLHVTGLGGGEYEVHSAAFVVEAGAREASICRVEVLKAHGLRDHYLYESKVSTPRVYLSQFPEEVRAQVAETAAKWVDGGHMRVDRLTEVETS